MPEEKETNLENGQATATAASTPSKSKPQRQKTPNRRRQNDSDVAGGVGITGGGVVILPQQVLNELYHNYSIKQRRSGLKWFLFAAVLFNIWTIVVPWDQAVPTRGELRKWIPRSEVRRKNKYIPKRCLKTFTIE